MVHQRHQKAITEHSRRIMVFSHCLSNCNHSLSGHWSWLVTGWTRYRNGMAGTIVVHSRRLIAFLRCLSNHSHPLRGRWSWVVTGWTRYRNVIELWIAGWTQRWNVVEWPCGWLAKSWDFTSFYKWAQDGAESFLVVVRQEIRAVRAGTIVARSRRLMQLVAQCFLLDIYYYTKNRILGRSVVHKFHSRLSCIIYNSQLKSLYKHQKAADMREKSHISRSYFLIKNHRYTG